MVEAVWGHALEFLDEYRSDSSYDISNLYQLQDSTGILHRHSQICQDIFMDSQVDMKIIFYELIRMLVDQGKGGTEEYEETRAIPKIEGYQDLTNKLLRHYCKINSLAIQELQRLKTDNSSHTVDQLESKIEQMESSTKCYMERVESLENKNKKLEEKIRLLENTSDQLVSDFKEIENEKQDVVNNTNFENMENIVTKHGENITFLNDNFNTLQNKIENIELTMESSKEDFDTQNQFELIISEVNKMKQLYQSPAAEQMSDIESKLEKAKEWSEQSFDYIEKKCQTDLIQTQSDIISNTNELTKVIENQVFINEKIKQVQEDFYKEMSVLKNMINFKPECSKDLVDTERNESIPEIIKPELRCNNDPLKISNEQNNQDLLNELPIIKGKIEKLESFEAAISLMNANLQKYTKHIKEIENNYQQEISLIKVHENNFIKTIVDEVGNTAKKIEALKITIQLINDKLEKTVVKEKQEEDARKEALPKDLKDLRIQLISQENEQNVISTKMNDIVSLISKIQEKMELLEIKINKLEKSEEVKSQNHQDEQHFVGKQHEESKFENIRKVEESKQGKNYQETIGLCKQQEQLMDMVDELKKDISSEKLKLSSIDTFVRTFHSDDLNVKNSGYSEVEKRMGVLEKGMEKIAEESRGLRNLIHNQKHVKQEIPSIKEVHTYSEIISKTESHEVKLEKLEKTIDEIKSIRTSAFPRYDGQIKTEQMEFISRKIEEQKKTLEIFFERIEEKFKAFDKAQIAEFPLQSDPGVNEYDTIDTHDQGENNLKEKIEEQKGKCSEKEVLLEMTNVGKSPFKLNKKYKEDYGRSGSSKKISSWLKKRRKALCCSCVAKQPSVLNIEQLCQA